ncbi:PAS domain-containing protein, partial [Caballeronia glebae]|uniref:PAS domain-containing protein n=1 Tax=Caballeronia glebae TaxID=1777143 RepID=UPI000B10BBFB
MQANRINVSRRAPWRIALDALSRVWGSTARERQDTPPDSHPKEAEAPSALAASSEAAAAVASALAGASEATFGAVDFLAQLDDALRFQYVSDASIEFIGYHRDYLSMLTLHDLVASEEADELHALVARARASGKLESATLTVVKSLTYPICVELRLLSTAARGMPGFAPAAFDVMH